MMPDFFQSSQDRTPAAATFARAVRPFPIFDLAILLTRTTNFVNTISDDRDKATPCLTPDTRPNGPCRCAKRRRSAASAPVIDLGVLNERLGYFIRRAQLWVFQDFIRRLSSLDISPAEFSVLVVIGANTGLSQAELATTLGIERARLVRLLHRLERRGLTQRLPSSADGRRHALRLTADGQKILVRAKMLAAQHEAALKEKLGAERHRLLLESLRAF